MNGGAGGVDAARGVLSPDGWSLSSLLDALKSYASAARARFPRWECRGLKSLGDVSPRLPELAGGEHFASSSISLLK